MLDFLQNLFQMPSGPSPTSGGPGEWVMLDETLQVRWNKPEPPQHTQGPVAGDVDRSVAPRLPTPSVTFEAEPGEATSTPPKTTFEGEPENLRAAPNTGTKATRAKPGTWTTTDKRWLALSPTEKAAAMSLLEADGADEVDANNALAAILNRSAKNGEDLSTHVSSRLYQPSFEPAQQARLDRVLKMPAFAKLTQWAGRYLEGKEADPTNGATHFLAHPKVMLGLEAREPMKYRSWRQWTGFDQKTQTYRNQTIVDRSHAFLAPEGRHSLGAR